MVGYGLIGKMLGHSHSADYFTKKFSTENIEAEYKLYPIEEISDVLSLIKDNRDLRGLNVTIPYKQSIIDILKPLKLTPEAIATGAVNTVRIIRDSVGSPIGFEGHNTDVEGFRSSLKRVLDARSDVENALVLGATGGAAKTVAYVLSHDFGIKVSGVTRNCSAQSDVPLLSYESLDKDIIESNPLIVNCTPLGMWPDVNEEPPIPYAALTCRHIGFDLIYNPRETRFLWHFVDAGGIAVNGLEMLFAQADASYKFWIK